MLPPVSSKVRKPAANKLKSSLLLQFLLCNLALLLLLLPGSVSVYHCKECGKLHDGHQPADPTAAVQKQYLYCVQRCGMQPLQQQQFADVLTSSACLPGAVGCPCSPGAHGCPTHQLAPAAPAAPYVIPGTDGRLISYPQPAAYSHQQTDLLPQANARLQGARDQLAAAHQNLTVPSRFTHNPTLYPAEVTAYNTAVQNYNAALGEVQHLRAARDLPALSQQQVAPLPTPQQQPTVTHNHHSTYTQTGIDGTVHMHNQNVNVHSFVRIHTTARTGPHAAHFPLRRR